MTAYNASVHRSIGMAPVNVNEDGEHELWRKQKDRRLVLENQKTFLSR